MFARQKVEPRRRQSRPPVRRIGEKPRAQAMAARLFELGVHVSGFFFPVVPRGQARIRTQMNAALSMEDLDEALAAFVQAGKDTGVLA
jgi:glycine C-acetyltransferase